MKTPINAFHWGTAVLAAGLVAGLSLAAAFQAAGAGRAILALGGLALGLAGLGAARALQGRWRRTLTQVEQRGDALLDLSADAIWVVRAGRVEQANRAAVRLLGARGASDLEGLDPVFLFHSRCQERVRDRLLAVRRGQPVRGFEETVVRLDGAPRQVEVAAAPFQDARGAGYHLLLRDTTQGRQRDHELDRFNRALRALARCRRALAGAGPAPEADLLAAVAAALGEAYPDAAVWIGLKDHDPARTLRPAARRAPASGILAERVLSWAEDGDGGGAAGEAARTGRMVLYPDLWAEYRREPLGEACRTVLALPLAAGDATLGVLALLAAEPEAITGGEARILETLALDLGATLAANRQDAGQGRAQAALRTREASFRGAFERNPVPMALTSPEGRLLKTNPALDRMLGYPREELETLTLLDVTHPDDLAPVRAALARLAAGHLAAVHLAQRCRRREGSEFWGTLDLLRLDDGPGPSGPLLTCLQDLTGRRHAEAGLQLRHPVPGGPGPEPAVEL